VAGLYGQYGNFTCKTSWLEMICILSKSVGCPRGACFIQQNYIYANYGL
jgi:hypothetical protein